MGPSLPRLTKRINYDKVTPMKKITILVTVFLFFLSSSSYAFWMWTPETKRWVNPKYDVKDTPQEQLSFASGYYSAKDYKKAINEFEKLIRNYPKSKEAADAQYHIGLSYEVQNRLFEAYKAYQKVVEKYPFSELFSDVIEKEYLMGEKLLNGEGRRGPFVSTIIGGEYDVIEIFRAVIKNAPYGKYAAPSQYKIGLYLSQKELHQEARDEFEKVVNDYPKSEWVRPAKYQIAIVDSRRSTAAQYDQRVTRAAVEEFKEFVKAYPDAELTDQAKKQVEELREKEAENNFVIGHFYEKQKDYASARVYFQTVVDEYEGSSWAARAVHKLKEIELKQTKAKQK